jgi:hypothetical protein
VCADGSIELPEYKLIKIAGNKTGLSISRLLKKADAGSNPGFPRRSQDIKITDGSSRLSKLKKNNVGSSFRLPRYIEINSCRLGSTVGGSSGLPGSKKADAGGNYRLPGRTNNNSGRQKHRSDSSTELSKNININYN